MWTNKGLVKLPRIQRIVNQLRDRDTHYGGEHEALLQHVETLQQAVAVLADLVISSGLVGEKELGERLPHYISPHIGLDNE